MTEILTSAEVSKILRISRSTLSQIKDLPWLDATGRGGAKRMRRKDLDAWIDSRVQWDRAHVNQPTTTQP